MKTFTTYWAGEGKYQFLYDKLKKLIPETGPSPKAHIELLRNFSNLYYDYYNNGFDNIYYYFNSVEYIIAFIKVEYRDNRIYNGSKHSQIVIDLEQIRTLKNPATFDSEHDESLLIDFHYLYGYNTDFSKRFEELGNDIIKYVWGQENSTLKKKD